MTGKEKQIERIKEYNEKYYPLINNTSIILHSFDHAIKKAGAYDEVMKQLKILGWNDEWKDFVINAVSYYADFLKGKHEIPDGSVVLSKEEYEILVDIKTLKSKVQEALNANPVEELIRVEVEARKETVREIINFIENLKVAEDGRHQWRDNHNDCIDKVILAINHKFINGVEVEEC